MNILQQKRPQVLFKDISFRLYLFTLFIGIDTDILTPVIGYWFQYQVDHWTIGLKDFVFRFKMLDLLYKLKGTGFYIGRVCLLYSIILKKIHWKRSQCIAFELVFENQSLGINFKGKNKNVAKYWLCRMCRSNMNIRTVVLHAV